VSNFLSLDELDVGIVVRSDASSGETGSRDVAQDCGVERSFEVLKGQSILQDVVVVQVSRSLVEDSLVVARNVSEHGGILNRIGGHNVELSASSVEECPSDSEDLSLSGRDVGDIGEGNSSSQEVEVSTVSSFNCGDSGGQSNQIGLNQGRDGSIISRNSSSFESSSGGEEGGDVGVGEGVVAGSYGSCSSSGQDRRQGIDVGNLVISDGGEEGVDRGRKANGGEVGSREGQQTVGVESGFKILQCQGILQDIVVIEEGRCAWGWVLCDGERDEGKGQEERSRVHWRMKRDN